MKIEYLRLKNFKTFRNVEMKEIPGFCVVVGANGSGKSTLFHVFGFLKEALRSNIHAALVKLGGSRGIQEVRSRNTMGDIEIELKFRERKESPLVAEEFRHYAHRGGQVFVSTHSPDFLNVRFLLNWKTRDNRLSQPGIKVPVRGMSSLKNSMAGYFDE